MLVDATGHVFISFSSRDLAAAKVICERLEASSVKCWISSRDITPGTNFQASIVSAIQAANILVLVFSDDTNKSHEVSKELALASALNVRVMPVRITDVRPNGALMYELATRQWIDAFEDWDGAMARLVATLEAASKGAPGADIAVALPARPAANVSRDVLAPPAPAVCEPPASRFSNDQLDTARKALSVHIGPIADVLVRKASAKATTLAELYDRLAAHIQSAEAQASFRKRLGLRR